MGPLEILEGNKLIATYMGYKYFPYNMEGVTDPGWKTHIKAYSLSKHNDAHNMFLGKIVFKDENGNVTKVTEVKWHYLSRNHTGLSYNKSWDWLMPVYIKISKLFKDPNSKFVCNTDLVALYTKMSDALADGELVGVVWLKLIDFLKAYNLLEQIESPVYEEVVPLWKRKHHFESLFTHWVVTIHNDKVTLTYVPNKKYSRYNVSSVMNVDEFEELIGFINYINGQ